MEKVLIISTHPDDETLGCGGTLLKHVKNFDDVFWLILTNINDEKIWGKERIEQRQLEIEKVTSLFGFKKILKLNYDTTKLDQLPLDELTKEISHVIKEVKPEVIYLHNRSDVHSDHRISFDAIISATKSFNHPYIKKVLMYETISETEFAPALQENAFIPNYFVDISEYIDKKIEIMRIYKSELKEHPFPRSERNIRALATFRGAQCGVDSAEAFMILKEIWK
jgi:N-acetylglucosamine malate deacetylase 1